MRTWQILKTGDYPQGSITKEMLQEISSTFGQRGDIPIGKGHDRYFWQDDLPAEGWIKANVNAGVNKAGNTFITEGVELLEPLASEYEEGRYKKWSAVIARDINFNAKKEEWEYGKWELMAVDVLGRTAPAIKGLLDLTNNKRKPELEKFGIEIGEKNTLKFSDGKEKEILHFSADFELSTNENNEENQEMNELEKKILELTKANEEKEAAFAKLQEQNSKLKEQAEQTYKAYKKGQVEILEKETSKLPEELRDALFSALNNMTGDNMDIAEDKSVYSILADCFKQAQFSDKASDSMPSHLQNETEQKAESEEAEYAEGKELLESSKKTSMMILGM